MSAPARVAAFFVAVLLAVGVGAAIGAAAGPIGVGGGHGDSSHVSTTVDGTAPASPASPSSTVHSGDHPAPSAGAPRGSEPEGGP